jgi:hypothetical protein
MSKPRTAFLIYCQGSNYSNVLLGGYSPNTKNVLFASREEAERHLPKLQHDKSIIELELND